MAICGNKIGSVTLVRNLFPFGIPNKISNSHFQRETQTQKVRISVQEKGLKISLTLSLSSSSSMAPLNPLLRNPNPPITVQETPSNKLMIDIAKEKECDAHADTFTVTLNL